MTPREKSLFSEIELLSARKRLEDSSFPLTDQAADIQDLGSPEPFLTYTVAAGESLRALQDDGDPRRLIKAARRTADIVDRVAKWVGEVIPTGKGKPLKVACKAGCFYCCSIRVNVLSAEVASISEYIVDKFSDSERIETVKRLDKFVAAASKLSPRTRFLKPLLCPLNENGLCTVYDVRPTACRSHHSFSVEQCRVSFEQWEEDHPVKRSAMRKACSDAAQAALVDVLAHVGLDSRGLELAEALQIAMKTPRLDHRLMNGDDVLGLAYVPAISEAADAPDLFRPAELAKLSSRKKSR